MERRERRIFHSQPIRSGGGALLHRQHDPVNALGHIADLGPAGLRRGLCRCRYQQPQAPRSPSERRPGLRALQADERGPRDYPNGADARCPPASTDTAFLRSHPLQHRQRRFRRSLEVTGPGALTALWDELPEKQLNSIRLINHEEAYRYHRNERNLEDRNVDHWSKQQLREPILDFSRAADLDKAARKAARPARAASTIGSGNPETK